jgi:hypothetical protein
MKRYSLTITYKVDVFGIQARNIKGAKEQGKKIFEECNNINLDDDEIEIIAIS